MHAGRAAFRERFEHPGHHPAAVALALRARQQVDVDVRRIVRVGLRNEIVGMMIQVIDLLQARPLPRITLRFGKLRGQAGPPVAFVALIELARIERAERVAADAVAVFEDQAESGSNARYGPTKMRPSASGSSR